MLGVYSRSRKPEINKHGAEILQPAQVAVVMKSAFAEDSPQWIEEICPNGYQMDVTGICREVWYDDYQYNNGY